MVNMQSLSDNNLSAMEIWRDKNLKPIIIDMKDLSESTTIYEKKPNPAIVAFVYIVLGITVISLLWMAFSDIDTVLKTDGVICKVDSLAEVDCDYNSKIVKANVKDGQYVNSGDILFELEDLPDSDRIHDDYAEVIKTRENLDALRAYDTFLNIDAKKIKDLDSSELDGLTENRYFEEYQIKKKILLNQLIDVKDDVKSFEDKILNEKMTVVKDIQTLEASYSELNERLSEDCFEDGRYVIRAKESGYYYSSEKYEIGDTLDEGCHIGDIYPSEQKASQVELFIFTSDIGKIREGMEVKFEIDAFPSREYGVLTGHIRKISKEATFLQEQGISYFSAWVDLDSSELINRNGERADLINGLMCKAIIVTGKKSVLEYVFDSIH